ncbi:rab-GTPase-TBC domain-containing protein [Lipomyces kononenkoae]|uniref:Rab-GTPase-TBC domain-containing protein n=1 Tax=Lipomyces kononenkoae TaxID=34357 RepID=A0ACC3T1V4_LIPKO
MHGISARKATHRRRDPIESALRRPPVVVDQGISELRYLILTQGLSNDPDKDFCTYRSYVWCILLKVSPTQSKDYLSLIHRGASPAYSKIRNDTFRTLTTDILFQRRVSETSLIRILNALAWKRWDRYHSRHKQQHQQQNQTSKAGRGSRLHNLHQRSYTQSDISSMSSSSYVGEDDNISVSELYVQGLNVLAAPFLYACASETQAFALFDTYIHTCCPLYVKPMLDGVHLGLKLLDTSLKIIDPTLYSHLKGKLLTAELYGFASVLTMSACTPPLNEVLVLWDFLIAFGPHMNILAVIAQLLIIRDSLLASQSPMTLLRTFPPLQAKKVITLAVSFVPRLPEELYDLLVRHTYDETVSDRIKSL